MAGLCSPAGMPGGCRLEQIGLAGLILMSLIPVWLAQRLTQDTGLTRRR